ncbi:MAG: hypothetical protein B7Z78_02915 [Rhodospirillales bacterium 20-60-12]|nr:MAG: hypothetical protein B7Z78_02915 [Rhodospirillales bacterium 20-60-12]
MIYISVPVIRRAPRWKVAPAQPQLNAIGGDVALIEQADIFSFETRCIMPLRHDFNDVREIGR